MRGCIYLHIHTQLHKHTHTFFFLIGSTSQSSGKLVQSSQLPLLPACFGGLAWSERSPSECTSAPALPQGKGGTHKLCKPLPLNIGVGAEGSPPGASQPQAMQGLGRWDGQAKHAPACPTPKHCAALPVDSRDFFSDWGKGQGPGGVTQSPPALFCRGSRDHPASKSYAWPPTLARLNPGDIN